MAGGLSVMGLLCFTVAFHGPGLLKDAEAGLCRCACITEVQTQSSVALMFQQRQLFIFDRGDHDQ